jgi:hypothetical protein
MPDIGGRFAQNDLSDAGRALDRAPEIGLPTSRTRGDEKRRHAGLRSPDRSPLAAPRRVLGRCKAEIHHSDRGYSTPRPLTGFWLEVASHAGGTAAVVFSPDGRRPATSGSDGMVRLWCPTTGERLAVLDGRTWWLAEAASTADGRTLVAAGSDSDIRVWDMGGVGEGGADPPPQSGGLCTPIRSRIGMRITNPDEDGRRCDDNSHEARFYRCWRDRAPRSRRPSSCSSGRSSLHREVVIVGRSSGRCPAGLVFALPVSLRPTGLSGISCKAPPRAAYRRCGGGFHRVDTRDDDVGGHEIRATAICLEPVATDRTHRATRSA